MSTAVAFYAVLILLQSSPTATAADPVDAPAMLRRPDAAEQRRISDLITDAGDLFADASVGRFITERRLAEAAQDLAEAETLARATYGPTHAVTLTLRSRRAHVLMLLGRPEEARRLLEQAVAGLDLLYPAGSAELTEIRDRLLSAQAQSDGGQALVQRLERQHSATDDPLRRLALASELARIHLDAGDTVAAEPWITELRGFLLGAALDDAALVSGPALLAGRFDLATADYTSAQTMFMTAMGAEAEMERLSVVLVDAVLGLSLALQGQGRVDEAVNYLRDARLIVESRDAALALGEGQARTVFSGVFRQNVIGLWRLSDRIAARRQAAGEAMVRDGP